MKYSQTIGLLLSLALGASCFLPWAQIHNGTITVTGLSAHGTDFGKPGMLNLILGVAAAVLFCVPAIWAKRTNIFVTGLNVAWALRSYLVVGTCLMGECPAKMAGLYLLLLCSIGMLLMSFFPRLDGV